MDTLTSCKDNDGQATAGWDWNIAVFCQNEQNKIATCLSAIEHASAGRRVLVCLIINGSSDESETRALAAAQNSKLDFMIARIAVGDKSNAINLFNYVLRVPARTYIYIDGYVGFSRASLRYLAAALDEQPYTVAATGVSINGRTMRLATKSTLEVGGQLHGQLHALRPAFIDRMVEKGIRLPIGTYWGDGLLGSMAAHDLDPLGNPWESRRIIGVEGATYEINSLSLFRYNDLKRQFTRMIRQARGRLQNLAIKDVIYQHGYQGLPDYADQMVRDYLAKHGVPRVSAPARLFLALALRQIARSKRYPADALKSHIVFASRSDLLDKIQGRTTG